MDAERLLSGKRERRSCRWEILDQMQHRRHSWCRVAMLRSTAVCDTNLYFVSIIPRAVTIELDLQVSHNSSCSTVAAGMAVARFACRMFDQESMRYYLRSLSFIICPIYVSDKQHFVAWMLSEADISLWLGHNRMKFSRRQRDLYSKSRIRNK